jgi:AcrR family transcriptional regulator
VNRNAKGKEAMVVRLSRDERRALIVSTAMRIIDERGHQGLTMRALAREFGMSAPGLMHYFPDLPTLVVAVVEYRDRRDEGLWLDGEEWQGRSRELLDLIIENIIAKPKAAELFAIVEAQAIDPRHPGHEYFRERAELIAAWLEPILGAEYAHPGDLASQLTAIMDGLQINWLREQDSFDLRAHWKAIADAVLGAAERKPSVGA